MVNGSDTGSAWAPSICQHHSSGDCSVWTMHGGQGQLGSKQVSTLDQYQYVKKTRLPDRSLIWKQWFPPQNALNTEFHNADHNSTGETSYHRVKTTTSSPLMAALWHWLTAERCLWSASSSSVLQLSLLHKQWGRHMFNDNLLRICIKGTPFLTN